MSKIIMGLSGAVTQGAVDQDLTVTTQPPAAAAGKSFKSCHVESINFFAAVPTGKTFQ